MKAANLGRLHFARHAGGWLALADEVVIERRCWQRTPIIYGAPGQI
jgi:hypothetical protein